MPLVASSRADRLGGAGLTRSDVLAARSSSPNLPSSASPHASSRLLECGEPLSTSARLLSVAFRPRWICPVQQVPVTAIEGRCQPSGVASPGRALTVWCNEYHTIDP